MELTIYLRRSFYLLAGFAVTTSLILLSHNAQAEQMVAQEVNTVSASCTAVMANTSFANEAVLQLSVPEQRLAFMIIKRFSPELLKVDKVAGLDARVSEINYYIHDFDSSMNKYSMQMSKSRGEIAHFYSIIQEKGAYNFWAKFGLHEVYKERFKVDNKDDKFFDSDLTLIQIYKKLMKKAMSKGPSSNMYGYYLERTKREPVEFNFGSGQWGSLLILNAEEIMGLPKGHPLWKKDGRMTWVGGSDPIEEADAIAGVWGIRDENRLGALDKWEFIAPAVDSNPAE